MAVQWHLHSTPVRVFDLSNGIWTRHLSVSLTDMSLYTHPMAPVDTCPCLWHVTRYLSNDTTFNTCPCLWQTSHLTRYLPNDICTRHLSVSLTNKSLDLCPTTSALDSCPYLWLNTPYLSLSLTDECTYTGYLSTPLTEHSVLVPNSDWEVRMYPTLVRVFEWQATPRYTTLVYEFYWKVDQPVQVFEHSISGHVSDCLVDIHSIPVHVFDRAQNTGLPVFVSDWQVRLNTTPVHVSDWILAVCPWCLIWHLSASLTEIVHFSDRTLDTCPWPWLTSAHTLGTYLRH